MCVKGKENWDTSNACRFASIHVTTPRAPFPENVSSGTRRGCWQHKSTWEKCGTRWWSWGSRTLAELVRGQETTTSVEYGRTSKPTTPNKTKHDHGSDSLTGSYNVQHWLGNKCKCISWQTKILWIKSGYFRRKARHCWMNNFESNISVISVSYHVVCNRLSNRWALVI